MQVNPLPTINFAGQFAVQSDGFVQGLAMDDPAVRNFLAGGQVGSGVTTPMWGGEAITETLPAAVPQDQGNNITLATTYANLTGFTVFNQGGAGLVSAQSQVPLFSAGMGINFYRMGSGARIVVACSSGLAAALLSGAVVQQVSWDFTNQVLVAFSTTALACKILDVNSGNSKVVSYNSGTGFATWNGSGSAVLIQI